MFLSYLVFYIFLLLLLYQFLSFRLSLGIASEKSKQCYESFFRRFGPEYQELIDDHFDVYHKVRCGLVHSYLIKNSSIINLGNGKCGVTIDYANDKYVFNIITYFEDFKKAVDSYINDLKSKDIEQMEMAFKDKPILI